MQQFTPQRVQAMRARSHVLVDEILDKLGDATAIDIVDDLAYPLPVTVICELLGIPPEDEAQFHGWATQLATALEPDTLQDDELRAENSRTFDAISDYMQGLIAQKRKAPAGRHAVGARHRGRRRPRTHERLRPHRHRDPDAGGRPRDHGEPHHQRHADPAAPPGRAAAPARGPGPCAPRVVEELLRYEPPVQFRTRKTLCPITQNGVTIPEGAPLVLLLASGNRDPAVYAEPDRFDPDRADNRHLGFGGSLHYCVGAPAGPLRGRGRPGGAGPAPEESAPDRPTRRPTGPGSALRGPKHLRLAIDGIAPRAPSAG